MQTTKEKNLRVSVMKTDGRDHFSFNRKKGTISPNQLEVFLDFSTRSIHRPDEMLRCLISLTTGALITQDDDLGADGKLALAEILYFFCDLWSAEKQNYIPMDYEE